MSRQVSPLQQDWAVWTGMLLLMVGLILANWSFAGWRDDMRHFADANGNYLSPGPDETPARPPPSGTLLKAGAFGGLGMIALSVVLLNKRRS